MAEEACHFILRYLHQYIHKLEVFSYLLNEEDTLILQQIYHLEAELSQLVLKKNTLSENSFSITKTNLFSENTSSKMRKLRIKCILCKKAIHNHSDIHRQYMAKIQKIKNEITIYKHLFETCKKTIQNFNIKLNKEYCVDESKLEDLKKEYTNSKNIYAEYLIWKDRIPKSAYEPNPDALLASYHASLKKQEELTLLLLEYRHL